jgi:AraC-like DNA-binding protein
MTDLIRSACLTHYAEIARAAGLDPLEMLRKVRLPVSCLGRPDLRIAVAGVRRLLEASAAAAGIDEFGLRMADRGDLSNLGSVALVVREQATIGNAIEALSRFIHIHHEGLRLRIGRDEDVVTVSVTLRGGRPRAPRQSTEMVIGSLHRIIRSLFGGDWRPLDVHLMHAPPRNRRYYRTFFGCNVIFNSEVDAILLAATDLGRPIPSAHPLIAHYLRKRVEAIETRSSNWDDKVAELVRSLLPVEDCSIERVAEHLACDRRTIHRHLAARGTSFSEILDAERADLVMRLIEDGNRPLKEMAALLGFSAQSAMARWFRGRFGCSISQWRSDDGQRAAVAHW